VLSSEARQRIRDQYRQFEPVSSGASQNYKYL